MKEKSFMILTPGGSSLGWRQREEGPGRTVDFCVEFYKTFMRPNRMARITHQCKKTTVSSCHKKTYSIDLILVFPLHFHPHLTSEGQVSLSMTRPPTWPSKRSILLTKHHDTQRNDIQHKYTQHKGLIFDTQHNSILSVIILNAAFYLLLCWVSLCWVSLSWVSWRHW